MGAFDIFTPGLGLQNIMQPLIFSGIRIPASKLRFTGGTRYHAHEFPHADGADIEKMGRKPHVVHATCFFDEGMEAHYPDCWPGSLADLRVLLFGSVTAELKHPTIGTIQAFCTNWTIETDFRIRSGEAVELEFLEDQPNADLVADLIKGQAASIGANLDAFNAAVELAKFTAQDLLPRPDIFDAINNAATAVLAIRDQADLYGQLVESKISAVNQLIGEADRTNQGLQNCDNYRVLNALKDLWASTVELAKDVALKRTPIQSYTVPRRMGVGEIATAIYGDSTRTNDVLQLNEFVDTFAVPTGTVVKYYADAV